VFNWVATLCTGIDFRNSSDFKLLDRKVVDAWRKLPERRCFFRGMVHWLGFRRVQIEFDVQPRSEGTSKWSGGALVRLAWTAITSYSTVPLKFIFVMAASFLVFAFLLVIRALYLYFGGKAFTGFTTVIILLLIVGGLLLFCLAIIGEYLAAIYDELKGRPRYLISDRTL
jgi:glycosyltransferase involved in cell wall biosynthesis